MTNDGSLFKGVIPPVVTIVNDDGKFDPQGQGKLIDFLIESGVHGLFFLGTTGEFSQMTVAERKEIAEYCVRYVDGRLPVLIGTGSTSTREAIELSLHSQKIGADGVVVINPYFWKLEEEFLYQHFSDIARALDIPVILYDFPGLTGQSLSTELVAQLAENHPNIVGIKQSVTDVAPYREMILQIKSKFPKFTVLVGFDDHLLNHLTLGGDGVVPGSANFIPHLTVDLYHAFIQKDYEKVITLQRKVAVIPKIYQIASPFVGVAKEGMKLVGLDVSTHVLPPTRKLNEQQLIELKSILKILDVLE